MANFADETAPMLAIESLSVRTKSSNDVSSGNGVVECVYPACHKRMQRGSYGNAITCAAEETLRVLPGFLRCRRDLRAELHQIYDLHESLLLLDPNTSPLLPQPARISVASVDALDAALSITRKQIDDTSRQWLLRSSRKRVPAGCSGCERQKNNAISSKSLPPLPVCRPPPPPPVVILNVTSSSGSYELGGGWRRGSIATQEESLCLRTSLSLSFPAAPPLLSELAPHCCHHHYRLHGPLAVCQALYARDVLVIRTARDHGHSLLANDERDIAVSYLPVVSVITVAPIHHPMWRHCSQGDKGSRVAGLPTFASRTDRDCTKDKMRLVLRVAAANGHHSLVLGALGCGSPARNPPADVAACWREVLREAEFAGSGWWRELCFAVPGPDGQESGEDFHAIFRETLDGMEV